MKDNELRGIVLQKYYDMRRSGRIHWSEVEIEDAFPIKDFTEIARISDQLFEHGLIHWDPLLGSMGETVGGSGSISALGVDVVEGTTKPPITITFDQKTISISNSHNVQIGNANVFSATTKEETINVAIDHSNFSEAEKTEAKSLWKKISDNKLLNTVLGAAAGEITKAALPHGQ